MNKLIKKISHFFLRVSNQNQIIFVKHLAVMIKAGMPILNSLTMIQKQTKSKSLFKILQQIIIDVDNGQFLSASLEQFQSVFGDLFINIIRVGEASGTLVENLNFLAGELEKKQELKRKIKGALIYPIIVLTATIGIVSLLVFFVFPKILPRFQDMNFELPLATRILIGINSFILANWPFILLGFFVFLITMWLSLKVRIVRYYYHFFLLEVPFIGSMIQKVNMANFTRSFGVLLKSGVKIVESLGITSGALSNLVYKNELEKAADEIRKGEQISRYFFKKEKLFPIMLAQMIEVGENTGNLSETLFYLAEFYEEEVDALTKNLASVLEPLLLLVMGVIVGFVALSIVMPIYSLTQSLSL
ncbi:MAG: type II secretion system F family protein [Patescibacteria group bacterium]